MRLARFFSLLVLLILSPLSAQAVTYANTSTTFNWVDSSSHTKIGYNTAPYKFNGTTGAYTCGTTPPIIDDTLSDAIPIGFNFVYAGVSFSSLRIMTNGRVQFNNNMTCGYGSPVQQLPYYDASLNYSMRIYGNDLDPTSKVDRPTYNTPCVDKSVCYISYATIGSAPYRSFVVTWNNIPEWTNGSNPVGAYNLQLILQENGEFIYQYGADTPGPQASLGQVGWQVDSSDYDTPQVGFPTNNSAIKFFIPQPVAEYRMEQTSWSSAVGQVLDTSGNGRHGTALGAIQTTPNGRVCRAGNFPANTTTAAIDAINTGINVPQTVGSAGTVTFWYKSNNAWVGGGDAQLLDATVVNGQWFFLVRRNNGDLRFVMTDSGGTVRAVETSAVVVAANTWKHIAVSWNFNALAANNSDHLRVYVDGVLQTQSSFTTNSIISPQIGTLYVGDNRSGNTGQNGTGSSANGLIDEFRIYNYEGGAALVQRDYNQGGAGCLSHYAIANAGTGVTCQQNTVTVTAHDSAHGNIIMPNNTTTILLSTSTGKGDWSLVSGYGVLNNGVADDGVATYLFNGEYQAVFALTHSTAATVVIHVTDGQFIESENPSLVISACSTVRFNACELSLSRCVPSSASSAYARLFTKLADTAFSLDAVKLKVDGTLENTFNGTVTVDLLANTNSGVSLGSNNCPTSQTAVIPLGNVAFSGGRGPAAGMGVASTAFSGVSPNYSAYRDIRVRFTCNAATCGSAMVACSSDNFAVRPKAFAVGSSANADASGSNASATPTVKAGANFTLTATSVPGYASAPKLDSTKVAAHSGAVRSILPVGNFNNAAVATGVASGTFTYPEVGYFGFLANGVYDDSFAAADSATSDCTDDFSNTADSAGKFGCKFGNSTATGYFGRFIPDHFALTSGAVSPACGAAFTYFSQDGFTTSFVMTAQNGANETTQNYAGSYAKLSLATWGAAPASAASPGFGFATSAALPTGSALGASATAPTGTWTAGVASIGAKHQVSRPTALTAETQVTVTALPVDADGVTMPAAVAVQTASTPLRYGRLALFNAFGSEKSTLQLPIQLQYWSGKSWVTNSADTCSAVQASDFAFAFPSATANQLSACETAMTVSGTAPSYSLSLAAPGAGNYGWTDITLNLGASASGNRCVAVGGAGAASTTVNRPWLQYPWGGTLSNPSARATFGVYSPETRKTVHVRELF